MQAVTPWNTAGTAGLVLSLLNWADRQPVVPAGFFEPPAWRLDPVSFAIGLVTGICCYILVEGFLTLKWAFIQLVVRRREAAGEGRQDPKPLYKIL